MAEELLQGVVCGAEDEGGGTEGDDGAVVDDDAILVAKYLHIQESAGVAGCITQDVAQLPLLGAGDLNGTMKGVDTGIASDDGGVDVGPLEVTPYEVVTHLQGNDLFEGELILHNDDAAAVFVVAVFVEMALLMDARKFGASDADGEFFLAMGTLKHQGLPVGILGFIEYNVIVALGTLYSFHIVYSLLNYIQSILSRLGNNQASLLLLSLFQNVPVYGFQRGETALHSKKNSGDAAE